MDVQQGGAVFNALDGAELAKSIVKQIEPAIRAQMEADANFKEHLTYPVVEWEWTLVVRAYPHEPGSFGAKAQGKLAQPKVTIVGASRVVDSSSDENTPDAVRAEAGIAVTRPQKTSAGIVADVPQPLQERR